MNGANPTIGTNVELLFCNSIKHQERIVDKICASLKVEGKIAHTYKTGSSQGKIDAVLRLDSGICIGANIKAFKADFNQLTRVGIRNFCSLLSLDNQVRTIFEDGVTRVSRNPRGGIFIEESDRITVRDALQPIVRSIVEFSMVGDERPDLLVLYDRDIYQMSIYLMDYALDQLLQSTQLSFSEKGVIKIGDYITIQRKGGDGQHKTHPRTSLKHPGNQIQVKIKPRAFVEKNKPNWLYSL